MFTKLQEIRKIKGEPYRNIAKTDDFIECQEFLKNL